MGEVKQEEKTELFDLSVISTDEIPSKGLQEYQDKVDNLLSKTVFFKIEDKQSFNLADRHRKDLKALRRELEIQEKSLLEAVKKKIVDFITSKTKGLLNPISERERLFIEEINRYKEEEKRKAEELAKAEEKRIKDIKDNIDNFKESWNDFISKMTFERVAVIDSLWNESVQEFSKVDHQEFSTEFKTAMAIVKDKLKIKVNSLKKQEEQRLENLKLKNEGIINTFINTFTNDINKANEKTIAFIKSSLGRKVDNLLKSLPEDFHQDVHKAYNNLMVAYDQKNEAIQKDKRYNLLILDNRLMKLETLGLVRNVDLKTIDDIPYEVISNYTDEEFDQYFKDLKIDIENKAIEKEQQKVKEIRIAELKELELWESLPESFQLDSLGVISDKDFNSLKIEAQEISETPLPEDSTESTQEVIEFREAPEIAGSKVTHEITEEVDNSLNKSFETVTNPPTIEKTHFPVYRTKLPKTETKLEFEFESDKASYVDEFKSPYQELFNHMLDQHNLHLTDSEMQDIINVVKKMLVNG